MSPHLAGIFVYPVKGARGTAVPEWTVDSFGPRLDRRWMIVDSSGVAITQRERPRLALLEPQLDGSRLRLVTSAGGAVTASTEGQRARRPVVIWNDVVDAEDAGDEPAARLSDFLGVACRLVHIPDDVVRQVNLTYGRAGDRVGFADAFPFLLTSQEALDELNRRLERPIPMNRFRPNLVVAGVEPHAEDGWSSVRIGDITFDVVKPCARCAVPTIDQQTGVQGKEPLRTLATYRRQNGAVMFGQNLIHRGVGQLRVGDPVQATPRT